MVNKRDFKGSVILNPVPVVLITSKNKEGKENVFTVAWVGTVNTKPPMLSISVRPERLSYKYIKETMEFVVNIPNTSLVKAIDYCGVRSGVKNDKISEMGFTMVDCNLVSPRYIEECPVNIECKVKSITKLGSHDLFLAEVVASHIDEDLIDSTGKIRLDKASLISYCHGEYFPIKKESIGSFGFSVTKKSTINKKNSKRCRSNR